MLRRGKILVAFLIICLCITSYFLYVNTRRGQYKVWVAKEDVLPGQTLTEALIKPLIINQQVSALGKDAILGKVASVVIPKGSIICAGVDAPRTTTGSLVHIPVSVGTAGIINPGDEVQLIGISDSHLTDTGLQFFGMARVAAIIDSGGHIHRHGPTDALPAVLVAEVAPEMVPQMLECIEDGIIYPILGGQSDVNLNDE